MRLHYIQHVPFEGPAAIEQWSHKRGHSLACTRLFEGQRLPNISELDGLIVMGGPMGVDDNDKYPWLQVEANIIRDFAASKKPLLGICLGAQLIAHALGAAVIRNEHTEIGWFPLSVTDNNNGHRFSNLIPDGLPVFHWHGDTFSLPENTIRLAASEACANQAFYIEPAIIGLQFHLEATQAWTERLIRHCSDELIVAPFVQTAEQMLAEPERFDRINQVMEQLLDAWISSTP